MAASNLNSGHVSLHSTGRYHGAGVVQRDGIGDVMKLPPLEIGISQSTSPVVPFNLATVKSSLKPALTVTTRREHIPCSVDGHGTGEVVAVGSTVDGLPP